VGLIVPSGDATAANTGEQFAVILDLDPRSAVTVVGHFGDKLINRAAKVPVGAALPVGQTGDAVVVEDVRWAEVRP
jgi:hypothetical protein